ncbi:MAG: CoA transferase [Acidimicrobiaceae bacterium]|nr:CoA transferase [Acidimicrobiaceae bacterium]
MVWELRDVNVGSGLPLEGVRVLDFSRVLAGPMAAMIAGDLGADVIKVEGPDGDPVRSLAPPFYGDDATYYLAVNRHRRNIVADLRDPHDFAAIEALVRKADAVVENYLPAQYAALGIERLRRANPDCVWVSVTPAASGTALAALPSFDVLAQARSGLMGVTGDASGGPTKVGAPLADVITGLYGAIALVTGLYARVAGRPGRHFEAPLLESTMSALINQAQGFLATSVNPVRLGNDHPSIAPYGPVRTSNGLIMLAVGTDAQFARLLEALGDDGLITSGDFVRNDQRVAGRDVLRESLERIFMSRSTDEWLEVLSRASVPHAPILDVAGAFAQETIVTGDFVGEMSTPHGVVRAMRTPLRIDGERPALRSGPRRMGEDTVELLGDASDYS